MHDNMKNNKVMSKNESENSKKKQNFLMKGINNCFFNKRKTISKAKNKEKIIPNTNAHRRKNILIKDIILKCFQNLDLESLGKAKQTCKEWKTLIENNEQLIWRHLCKNYWGLDHKIYTNNKSYHIYEVRWKEIFLLNFNMQHEKYYFTSHHQPFQLGQAQKQSRFNQTYLNINPYAFKSSSYSPSSSFSSYYPFPYPNPKNIKEHLNKKRKSSKSKNGLVTPLTSSVSSSYSSSSSSESSSSKPQQYIEKNNYYYDDIPSSSNSIKENENDSSESTFSMVESPSSSSSSSSDSIIMLPESLDKDDDYDYEFDNISSSSSSNEQSSFSSYLSKLPFINKFSGKNSNPKSKKKYLMIWPYGRSEPYTVSICGHYLFWIYNFREIQVYDIETKRYIHRLKGHDEEIGLVLSNHQHYIVSFDLNSEIIVWDIRNFSIKRRFNVRNTLGLIISMSVHKDRMVATNNKGLIMVWNINTGELITTYKIPKEFINPNEEENYTNVALWNDYIAFALQSSVYFIYDISKNKCINIMYHPQNQKAQEMFHLIRPNVNGTLNRNNGSDDVDNDVSNINQILAMINNRQSYSDSINDFTNINHHHHHHRPRQPHPILEEETQEMMMPNPNNSNDAYTEEEQEEDQPEPEGNIVNHLNQLLAENEVADDEVIRNELMPPQTQYPFTLAVNSHLLLTNGPERNMLSIWSLKTGELLYNLSESRALEKLDLHLPALRMVDLSSEINFAEFSTDYSFIYTTIQYEEESSLAVWDFRSDQYPQKSRYFDIIDLDIEEHHRQFWIGYENEDEDENEN